MVSVLDDSLHTDREMSSVRAYQWDLIVLHGWLVGRGGYSLRPITSHRDHSRQYLDRYGRKRILVLNIFVAILGDFLTFITFFFPNDVPGGYWILVIVPLAEGILGSKSV